MYKKHLLPSGFADLLLSDAEKEEDLLAKLRILYRGAGYRAVRPAMAEFGVDEACFNATDPVSGRNIHFRSDITPQINRIASSFFADEKMPLRLYYSGQVMRISSSEVNHARQVTQSGVELIGLDLEQSFRELLHIVRDCLQPIDITVDISQPCGSVVDVYSDAITSYCTAIGEEVDGVKFTHSNDDFSAKKYHKKLAFSIFSSKSKEELGRGGAYMLENGVNAIGFSFNINRLLKISELVG